MSIELNPAAKKGWSRGGNGPVLHISWRADQLPEMKIPVGEYAGPVSYSGKLDQKCQLASHGSAILLSIVDVTNEPSFTLIPQHASPGVATFRVKPAKGRACQSADEPVGLLKMERR